MLSAPHPNPLPVKNGERGRSREVANLLYELEQQARTKLEFPPSPRHFAGEGAGRRVRGSGLHTVSIRRLLTRLIPAIDHHFRNTFPEFGAPFARRISGIYTRERGRQTSSRKDPGYLAIAKGAVQIPGTRGEGSPPRPTPREVRGEGRSDGVATLFATSKT